MGSSNGVIHRFRASLRGVYIQSISVRVNVRDSRAVDDELVSREELTATLFAIADIREGRPCDQATDRRERWRSAGR
jgi:hypothetical protein